MKPDVAPFQRKLSFGLVTVACIPGLLAGALVMYMAWQLDSQGEFHGNGIIHWGNWLGLGASIFFVFSGIPLVVLLILAAMRRFLGWRDHQSNAPSASGQWMKRFSEKVFVLVIILHICGTIFLIDAAVSRMKAYEHGEKFLWLTVLSWIWEPIPMFLQHYFQFGPTRFLYSLALPWSACVGIGFGFLVPRFSRWRRRSA